MEDKNISSDEQEYDSLDEDDEKDLQSESDEQNEDDEKDLQSESDEQDDDEKDLQSGDEQSEDDEKDLQGESDEQDEDDNIDLQSEGDEQDEDDKTDLQSERDVQDDDDEKDLQCEDHEQDELKVEDDKEHNLKNEEIKSETFKDLGVIDVLCNACNRVGWTKPTAIQVKAIPGALQGHDVIGLAETGSGKTGAFAIPILQNLLANPQRLFALVLTPTRELAYQIKEQFEGLGKAFRVVCSVVVGGMDMKQQAEELRKNPHIVIGTPGRVLDHLKKTKGFSFRSLKYLVMDEADRILADDFEEEVNAILQNLPKSKKVFLFSATMTSKVNRLQRVLLEEEPIRVEVSSKYQTVSTLKQYVMIMPQIYKPIYLAYILYEIGKDKSVIIFCMTQSFTIQTTLTLRALGFSALPLFGKMDQNRRLGVLNKFRSKEKHILLATDVASRGLDIPNVDYVINYDCPNQSKDYIHRVGRTARAGKSGTAITLIDQYTSRWYKNIEHDLKVKLPLYPADEDDVMVFKDNVLEAVLLANKQKMKLNHKGEKRKFQSDDNKKKIKRKK